MHDHHVSEHSLPIDARARAPRGVDQRCEEVLDHRRGAPAPVPGPPPGCESAERAPGADTPPLATCAAAGGRTGSRSWLPGALPTCSPEPRATRPPVGTRRVDSRASLREGRGNKGGHGLRGAPPCEHLLSREGAIERVHVPLQRVLLRLRLSLHGCHSGLGGDKLESGSFQACMDSSVRDAARDIAGRVLRTLSPGDERTNLGVIQYGNGTVHTLYPRSVTSICPGQRLNDDVVHAGLHFAAHLARAAGINVHVVPCYWFRMATSTGSDQNSQRRRARSWKSINTNVPGFLAADLILLALQPDAARPGASARGDHRALGIMDVKRRRLEFFCSLHEPAAQCRFFDLWRADADLLFKDLARDLTNGVQSGYDWTGCTDIDWGQSTEHAVPRQQDGDICGAAVVAFGVVRAGWRFPSFGTPHVNSGRILIPCGGEDLRLEVAAFILLGAASMCVTSE